MKAHMDSNGVITIAPDSSAEAFALRIWQERNQKELLFQDPGQCPVFWKADGLKIDMKDQNS